MRRPLCCESAVLAVKPERKPGQPMLDTLFLVAIFAVLAFLAIWFARVTMVILIVLFLVAIGSGVAFLSLGLHWHF